MPGNFLRYFHILKILLQSELEQANDEIWFRRFPDLKEKVNRTLSETIDSSERAIHEEVITIPSSVKSTFF